MCDNFYFYNTLYINLYVQQLTLFSTTFYVYDILCFVSTYSFIWQLIYAYNRILVWIHLPNAMELDELKLRKQVITERFYSVANKIKYKSIFHLRGKGKDAQ